MDGMPGTVRLPGRAGCLLCGTREEAAQVWLRWFTAENHGDSALLRCLHESAGFCPPQRGRRLGSSIRTSHAGARSARTGISSADQPAGSR
jgi:hypothetical protein